MPKKRNHRHEVPHYFSRCILAAIFFLVILVVTTVACSRPAPAKPSVAQTSGTPDSSSTPTSAVPDRDPPAFNASRAMQYVKEIVAYGPRPIGSENHKKVEAYILDHLKGDEVENDDFEITATEGRFPIHNIIAKFPGSRDGIIVIASHYDTNWPLRNENYVGANDGGSSSGLLLEIANQLHGKKRDGYSVWLLWDDGEESMRLPWYDPEALYGVRHLAAKWQSDGTIKKIKAFILEDMVGDADLNIEHDTNSTPWLEDLVYQAATELGYQSHFFAREMPVDDDHEPFVKAGTIGRPDRFQLRLQRRFLAHYPGHARQTQPEEPCDRGHGDTGNSPLARPEIITQ